MVNTANINNEDPSFGYMNLKFNKQLKNGSPKTAGGENLGEANKIAATGGVISAACTFIGRTFKTAASGLKTASLYGGSFLGGCLVAGSTIQTIHTIKKEPTREGMKKAIAPITSLGIGVLLTAVAQWAGSPAQKNPLAFTTAVGVVFNSASFLIANKAASRPPAAQASKEQAIPAINDAAAVIQ